MLSEPRLNVMAIADVTFFFRWAIEKINVVHSFSVYQSEIVRGNGPSGAPAFHELTGGEYKTQERIHRGVADPRLLAIPASWSRVADSNPN
jgi:hypothetical protein